MEGGVTWRDPVYVDSGHVESGPSAIAPDPLQFSPPGRDPAGSVADPG